ncbi:MAG: DNA polymerase/3'-5' exonuclease PolX [Elusimicrobia bacterium]|nr:DNA polymerase/3'-5' exonuclease PolX [Elusimicrobiota bacterium]
MSKPETTNAEIIRLLSLMGHFLEIKGENPFRVRAYERAAQTLSGLTRNLSEMAPEELGNLPGIGPGMTAHIQEILSHGNLKDLETIKKQIPEGIIKLLDIQGMGPKRAKLLWQTLKIDSIEALKKAAVEGKLRDLPGFGEKLEQSILKGADFAQAAAKRMLIWDARTIAADIVQRLKKSGVVVEAVAAGSLRRGKETVGDLDILTTARNGSKAIEFFTKLEQVERVLGAGETKATVWLKNQIQCDFRVVAPDSFGAALLYFTGSKEHNVVLREQALKLGMTINEYGIFKLTKGKAGRKVASKTEEEIYKALGMKWIPPELRENRGEIQAARSNKLPKLIELQDIRGDFHNHTKLTDGANALEEMAEAARAMGWEWVFVGDHSQSLKVANGLSPADLHRTIKEAQEFNAKSKGFRIFRSMEVDILKDGRMDYTDEDLGAIGAVIAAVHTHFKISGDEMTKRVIRAIENSHVDIIAHLSGRLLNRREPYEINVEEVLGAAAKNQTALELNGQPERQDIFDTQAKRAKELGVPLVLTTDAHSVHQFGYIQIALNIARRAWLEKQDLLNTMSAKEICEWLGN